MNLVDRYLQAVGIALPRAQRADLLRELSDNILSQIEAGEESLGRPLSEAEQAEILQKLGHPLALASSYAPPQQLIGAAIFPLYRRVLTILLVVAVAAQLLATVIAAAADPHALWTLVGLPTTALSVFGWVTLVFAVIERFDARHRLGKRWDPRNLPPLVSAGKPLQRRDSLIGAAAIAAVVIWWLLGLRQPYLILGPSSAIVTFAPVWNEMFALFALSGAFEVGRQLFAFAQPAALRVHAVLRVIRGIVALAILYGLLRGGDLFVLANGAATHQQLGSVLPAVNFTLRIVLAAGAVAALVHIAAQIRTLASGRLAHAR